MKRIRLKGKALKELNDKIFERDKSICILCGEYVLHTDEESEKFHHQRFGSYKNDRIECGCVLCKKCHYDLHFGENSAILIDRVEHYLSNLYPKYWREVFNV